MRRSDRIILRPGASGRDLSRELTDDATRKDVSGAADPVVVVPLWQVGQAPVGVDVSRLSPWLIERDSGDLFIYYFTNPPPPSFEVNS